MQSNRLLYSIIFLLIVLFHTSKSANGQIFTRIRNYYATDSASFSGVVLESKGHILNAQHCYLKQGKGFKLLSPYDISEYGFEDGTRYFSREISLKGKNRKRVFLERLEGGDLDLYYYREKGLKTFFIETKEGKLLEVPERTVRGEKAVYKDQMELLTRDCPSVAGSTRKLNYSRISLGRLVRSYNDRRQVPLLGTSYGVRSGVGLLNIFSLSEKETEYLEGSGFIFSPGFSIAVFVEEPLGKGNNSLLVEIGMMKFGMHRGWTIEQIGYEFFVENTRLVLPLLYRHNLSDGTEGFFIEAGVAAAYNLHLENKCYRSTYSNGVSIIEMLDKESLFASFQAGPLAGYGFEKGIPGFASIIAELRLGVDISFQSSRSHNSYLQLSCGLKF